MEGGVAGHNDYVSWATVNSYKGAALDITTNTISSDREKQMQWLRKSVLNRVRSANSNDSNGLFLESYNVVP